jgi:predicted metal-dependent HD superfamily phosphohydrolase
VHAHDNEALSAALAVDCLRAAGAGDEVARRVLGLIMATRHHQPGGDPDCTILLDIDLAILGATPERFAEYERQVRQEYAHVPEANYREARALVMQGFLARPRIFATATFFERYEARARANLGA